MATELAITGDMSGKLAYAKQLASSGMLPRAYQNNPGNVLWAVEYGLAMGVPPVVAIGMIHVMDGKPVASAAMIAGLVRKAGHRLRVESDDNRAVAKIARADDPDFWFEAVFSMADAKKAGVAGNATWSKWPRNMMEARALTAVARKACSEVLLGIQHTAEELGGEPSGDDLPSGASIAPAPSVEPQRWSDGDRKGFCASLTALGFEYDTVAAWCESLGKPRPSAMPLAQRNVLLAHVAGGKGAAQLNAWIAAQAPAPVDLEFSEPEPFFDAPPSAESVA